MQPQNVFQIFTGDDKIMSLKAVYAETGDPLDLTSCSDISIALPNADGTTSVLTLLGGGITITSPALLGKIAIPILNVVSSLLNVGEQQTFDVTFTISGKQTTVRYYQALTVSQR